MKRNTKNILIAVLCSVLVSGAVLTAVGQWTDGSFDVVGAFRGDRNAANLITTENILLKTQTLDNGLEIEVDDDGVVKIKGEATEDWEGTVAVLTLKAGTYTVGGYDSVISKSGVKAVVNNAPYYAGVENQDNGATFTLTEETSVSVKIFVKKGEKFTFGETFRPTLAMGSVEIDFYK